MSDRESSGVHVWLVLFRATRAVEAHATSHIDALGLCYSDFAVLEALLHKGPMPINTLGQKVLLTSGSMTPAVDRLEQRGLVQRRPAEDDRRIRVVELTGEGTKLIRKAFAEHKDAMERAASPLSATERITLVRLLKRLGKGAQALLEGEDKEPPKTEPLSPHRSQQKPAQRKNARKR
jgi:MarR family 2-MHQ and catechol resistance regulon transcriptional repressor